VNSAARRALITGITGQDGSYLAELLLGDPAKAREALGWSPKVRFRDLVAEMVEADLRLLGRGERAPAPGVLVPA
jgi:GDP-D-mannose dehydratase